MNERSVHQRLLDGRNRLAACELAGVEPRFETRELAEEDARWFINQLNTHRRHLTKGARAMAVALEHPDHFERGGEVDRDSMYSGNTLNISRDLLNKARLVLREFGEDAPVIELVLAGGSLKEAYEQAQESLKLTRQRGSVIVKCKFSCY